MSKATLEKWLEEKLDSIRNDLNAGDLDSAREQLKGIPPQVGSTSEFSQEIGELYWQLDYPAMAGRYWYLIENKTPEMISACKDFEHSCGDHPYEILNTLGWRFDGTPYAQNKLYELQKHYKAIQDSIPPFELQKTGRDRIALIGCGVVSIVLIFIIAFGFKAIFEMFQ